MNKGLEALEKLVDRLAIKKYDESGNLIYWKSTADNEFHIIETELKRLEKYDNSHLVVLPRMSGKNSLADDYMKACEILRIIKEKECLFKGLQNLTQAEFDLLKEELL